MHIYVAFLFFLVSKCNLRKSLNLSIVVALHGRGFLLEWRALHLNQGIGETGRGEAKRRSSHEPIVAR